MTIPTNIDLAEGSKEHFGRFYTALFDRTVERNPKAIVTEYSWNASSCDPCPGPALSYDDFAKLGADALSDATPGNPTVTVAGVTGNASPGATSLIPKRFQQRVQACWTQARAKSLDAKGGRVEVKLAWGADGKVKSAAIGANDTGDKELADCIEKPFKNAQLPPEEASITIAYALGVGARAAYRPWTLTRLHARYTKESLGEDIVFRVATPITGGREVKNEKGELERGATKVDQGGQNNFQGRYVIRHPWVGPIDCENPVRGNWGGPWPELGLGWGTPVAPASSVAFAPRGGVELVDFVRSDVNEIGVKAGKGPLPAKLAALAPATSGDVSNVGAGAPPPAETGRPGPETKSGCGGCATEASGTSGRASLAAIFLALVTIARRRTKK